MNSSLTRTLVTITVGAVAALSMPDSAIAKDKGKGHGGGPKIKGHPHSQQVIKKVAKSNVPSVSRSAAAFAPGRSGNLPPGHGGVPPGQLKKAVSTDVAVQRYLSVPRSNYGVALSEGYAGRGYYFGPRDVPYYYEGPGIQFFPSRDLVPQDLWGRRYDDGDRYDRDRYDRGDAADMQLQSALSRLGYYRGPIDGDIGPGTRAAIARFQEDRGLPVTGRADSSVLSELGLMY